jgi:hypothetical protein
MILRGGFAFGVEQLNINIIAAAKFNINLSIIFTP